MLQAPALLLEAVTRKLIASPGRTAVLSAVTLSWRSLLTQPGGSTWAAAGAAAIAKNASASNRGRLTPLLYPVSPAPGFGLSSCRPKYSGHVAQTGDHREPEGGNETGRVAALAAGLRNHRIDQHHQQRARREPVDAGLQLVGRGVGDGEADDRREGADRRDRDPQPDDPGARGLHACGGADGLRQ